MSSMFGVDMLTGIKVYNFKILITQIILKYFERG